MSRDRDAMRSFRQEYLDYVEGLRTTPPSTHALSDADRRATERWVKSLNIARGIDPHASRPSVADLLSRVGASELAASEAELGETLLTGLRDNVDPGSVVVSDVASIEAGLASRMLVQARGVRVRVLIQDPGTDIDSAYGQRIAGIAAVFGAFPDTSAALLTTLGPEPLAVVVDRDDIVSAIETPSGQSRPPRIRRSISDPVLACQQFFLEAIPRFDAFDYLAVPWTGSTSDLIDRDRLTAAAVERIVTAGQRARLEVKRIAWSGLGTTETKELSAWLKEAMQGGLEEADYRRRLAELVEAA